MQTTQPIIREPDPNRNVAGNRGRAVAPQPEPLVQPRTARARRMADRLQALLQRADVELNGARPHDVYVRDHAFYDVNLAKGHAALRDAYVDGLWDTGQLDVLTCKVLRAGLAIPMAGRLLTTATHLFDQLVNRQSRRGAVRGVQHYQLGDDLFQAMLDPNLVYSCGYWKHASTLAQAQEHKLELVCRKLGLSRGMRVLDVGCGWGSFARHAAERHGVSVLGITLSPAQARIARARCAGLPVEIRLCDYRALDASDTSFDAIVSLGVLEHIGRRNHRRYFEILQKRLADDGLILTQSIGGNRSQVSYDRWMEQNIFPNAFIPSAADIARASEDLLVLEDWHNFGADYDRTLMAWHGNLNRRWSELADRYDARFRRMWSCYLLTCAGAFRARRIQLWQVVGSPLGRPGGYQSLR